MTADLKKPNLERLLTTLRGGIPGRVPNFEILIEARNVKALLGQDVGTTMAASRGDSAEVLLSTMTMVYGTFRGYARVACDSILYRLWDASEITL